jgi:hypothetical protein
LGALSLPTFSQPTTRPTVQKLLREALGSLPQTVDVGGEFPILWVVAAWPSVTSITIDETHDKHPLATLKMERVQDVNSTSTSILHALGRRFEVFSVKHCLDIDNEMSKEGGKMRDANNSSNLSQSKRARTSTS